MPTTRRTAPPQQRHGSDTVEDGTEDGADGADGADGSATPTVRTDGATTAADLWDIYWTAECDAVRDAALQDLTGHYTPLVHNLADRVTGSLPPTVDRSEFRKDLRQEGFVALVRSIRAFDPDNGSHFEGYASTRIRGAMLDWLRSIDWLSRAERRRARAVQDALVEHANVGGTLPDDQTVAAATGLTVEEVRHARSAYLNSSPASLDAHLTLGSSAIHGVALTSAPNLDPEYLATNDTAAVLDAIRRLEGQRATVIALYYFEQFTFREISQVMGVSESRISQIHKRATVALADWIVDDH